MILALKKQPQKSKMKTPSPSRGGTGWGWGYFRVRATEYYAHSVEGKPTSEWHGLHDHLLNVAGLAKKFASAFNSGDWAYLAGLAHRNKIATKGTYVS